MNTDDVETRRRFAAATGANFPMLADPSGETVRRYGAMGPDGLARRVTYLIGPDGTVQGVDGAVDSTIRGTGPERISLYAGELELLLSDWRAQPGGSVPRFMVPDAEGRSVSPRRGDETATVLLVLGDRCGRSAVALAELESVASSGTGPRAGLFALVVASEGQSERFSFPVTSVTLGFDTRAEVAPRLDARTTPWVYFLGPRGQVLRSLPWPERHGPEVVRMHLSGRPAPLSLPEAAGTPIRR